MKRIIVTAILLLTSMSMSAPCTQFWQQQNEIHKQEYSEALSYAVKDALVTAYSRSGVTINASQISFSINYLNIGNFPNYFANVFELTPIIVTIDGHQTEYILEVNSDTKFPLFLYTILYAEDQYNAIGDIVQVNCSSIAWAKKQRGEKSFDDVTSFVLLRGSNRYLVEPVSSPVTTLIINSIKP